MGEHNFFSRIINDFYYYIFDYKYHKTAITQKWILKRRLWSKGDTLLTSLNRQRLFGLSEGIINYFKYLSHEFESMIFGTNKMVKTYHRNNTSYISGKDRNWLLLGSGMGRS